MTVAKMLVSVTMKIIEKQLLYVLYAESKTEISQASPNQRGSFSVCVILKVIRTGVGWVSLVRLIPPLSLRRDLLGHLLYPSL